MNTINPYTDDRPFLARVIEPPPAREKGFVGQLVAEYLRFRQTRLGAFYEGVCLGILAFLVLGWTGILNLI